MISIQELLKYHRPAHSRVQMDNAITRKTGCTYYGMFKQAVRELSGRWDALRAATIDLLDIEYQLADSTPDVETRPPFQRMRLQLRHEALLAGLEATAREAIAFYEQAVALRGELPEELTDDTIEQLELDYSVHFLTKQMALETDVHGGISVNTLDLVLSMPTDIKKDLLKLRSNPTELAQFLANGSVTPMPKVVRLGVTTHQVIEQAKDNKPLQLL